MQLSEGRQTRLLAVNSISGTEMAAFQLLQVTTTTSFGLCLTGTFTMPITGEVVYPKKTYEAMCSFSQRHLSIERIIF